jgi:uncharacterized protein
MKIGIVSDTHRNKTFLHSVVEWLVKRHKITTVFHLGDDYADVMDLTDRYVEVVQVPGIYDREYQDKTTAPTIIETIQGLDILLVHALDKDLTPEEARRADIILYGHTHHAEIRLEDGLLYVNPGHLKSAMDKNAQPSFGLLEIQDKNVSVKIIGTDFKVIQEMALIRSGSGLFKV